MKIWMRWWGEGGGNAHHVSPHADDERWADELTEKRRKTPNNHEYWDWEEEKINNLNNI